MSPTKIMISYHLLPLSLFLPLFHKWCHQSFSTAQAKSPEIIFVHLFTVPIPKYACFPNKHLMNAFLKVNPQDNIQKKTH